MSVFNKQKMDILIVENSSTQALFLKRILIQRHFQCDLAHNGKEALELLKTNVPNLIISSLILPDMNGYDLCKASKRIPELHDTPVMLLTSLLHTADLFKGLASAVDHIVMKPFDAANLITRIENIFNTRRLRKTGTSSSGVLFHYAGEDHVIESEKHQILDLLFSTFDSVIQQNQTLQKRNLELENLNKQLEVKIQNISCSNVIAENSEQDKEERNTNQTLQTRHPTILLVEDHRDKQNFMKNILEGAGHTCVIADTKSLVLEAVKKFNYHLILMNVLSSAFDSFQVVKEIRKIESETHEHHVQIIAYAYQDMPGIREKCRNHNLDDFVIIRDEKMDFNQFLTKWLRQKPMLLVVDDSACNRNLIELFIKKHGGYNLIFAENGQQAVSQFKNKLPSLIFMDMEMPVMNGFQAAQEIRKIEKESGYGRTPIIALTAHNKPEIREKCQLHGMDDYMCKPLKKKQLIATIDKWSNAETLVTADNS
ncbi:MAG: response regulator [bacterium]